MLSGYNKLIRPITKGNKQTPLVVKFKMRLSQLLDVVSLHSFYDWIYPTIITAREEPNRNDKCVAGTCKFAEGLHNELSCAAMDRPEAVVESS